MTEDFFLYFTQYTVYTCTDIGLCSNMKSEVSEVTYGQFVLSALHITHPKCTHTAVHTHTQHEHTPGAVGSHLCCGARRAVGGSVTSSRAPQ